MKTLKLILLLSLVMLFSCKKNLKTGENFQTRAKEALHVKTPSGGGAGEVEVVITKKLWDGPVGDTLFNILAQPFPALPQEEPFFKIIHIEPQNLKSLYKEHRNIIIIQVQPQLKKAWFIEHDRWALNQIIITYQAPDEQQMIQLLKSTEKKLLDTLYTTTLLRYQQAYMKYLNRADIDTIEKRYQVSLIIPSTYHLDVKKKNFAWISQETAKTAQEILIYITPYTSEKDLSVESIIRRRDSVAKYNVPGPSEGSYMQTEHLYPVQAQVINQNGHYAVLCRGLWKTHGDFMGGPFVNLTIVDQKRGRLVTIDGFVYAGKQDKKLYLWQVEAIVRSAKILE